MPGRSEKAGATAFAMFGTTVARRDVPDAVVHAARLHLPDTVGCGVAAVGLGQAPHARQLRGVEAPGTTSGIGIAHALSPASSALANGITCHALDFDDTHPGSIAHVSSVVVPAALAAAEATGADLGALLTALVVGNEVTCRIGLPVGDAFHNRGFHPTAVCGVFGAVAAVAHLTGLGADATCNALGIAGSMAGGIMAFLTDGSDTKAIHPGWMAHAAHVAVELAAHGARGPAQVLEGRSGIYEAFLDRPGTTADLDALGQRWETPTIAFKPYPACHFMHAALDALAALIREDGLERDAVAGITVTMPRAGIDLVLSPLERKHRPQTAYEARFSAPFALAALLLDGRVDVSTFTAAHLDRADIHRLAALVDYEQREYPTFPAALPAGVRVHLTDGTELERHLAHQRGGIAFPMTEAELGVKFRTNTLLALGADAVERLEALVLDAPEETELADFALLRHATAAQPASSAMSLSSAER